MTLQERILEALGEKALKPRALYGVLRSESPAGVDIAVSALLKRGVVTFELGHCQRAANGRKAQTISEPRLIEAPARDARELTPRERQVFDLVEGGLSHEEAGQRLGITKWVIRQHVAAARQKLGIKPRLGRPPRRNGEDHSAPSAVVPLSVVPSQEGAKAATVGADLPSKERGKDEAAAPSPRVPKIDIERRRAPTFSPDLLAWLVEQQRSKAMLVQVLCDKLAMAREDLAQFEQLVRVATQKEGAG